MICGGWGCRKEGGQVVFFVDWDLAILIYGGRGWFSTVDKRLVGCVCIAIKNRGWDKFRPREMGERGV